MIPKCDFDETHEKGPFPRFGHISCIVNYMLSVVMCSTSCEAVQTCRPKPAGEGGGTVDFGTRQTDHCTTCYVMYLTFSRTSDTDEEESMPKYKKPRSEYE